METVKTMTSEFTKTYSVLYSYLKNVHGEHIKLEDPSVAEWTVFDVKPQDLLSIQSDVVFAEAIYLKLLNRFPAEADIKRIVNNLQKNPKRASEIKKIINSAEFQKVSPKLSSEWRAFS